MPLRRRVALASSTRYTLAALFLLLVAVAGVLLISRAAPSRRTARSAAVTGAEHQRARPGGVGREPPPALRRQPAGATASVGSSPGRGAHRALAVEQPDPYAAQSFPVSRSNHSAAVTPATAGSVVAPGAPSDSQVQQELAQMHAATRADGSQQAAAARGGSIGGNGAFTPPANIPAVVARVIAGANAITDFPYVYGGGHASFVDNAYDCSGSVSYALAAGGLLSSPETSGQLESWGVPGPGRWITVEAAGGHTYMYVAGLRFDTAGRSGPYSSRWQTGILTNAGFVTRHPPGL